MKDVIMINGSPKNNIDNNSNYFIDSLSKILDSSITNFHQINIKNGYSTETFSRLLNSNSIVFAFPLYVDSLPSTLLSFMVAFEEYMRNNDNKNASPRVYSIVNCGFFEGYQNKIALEIMQNFCNKINLTWRFGIGIGAGEFVGGSKANIPLNSKINMDTYNALIKLKNDIELSDLSIRNNIFTSPKMPRVAYKVGGDLGWVQQARKNKVKLKNIFSKPYCND